MVGSHPVVGATAGPGDGRGGAGTPDGAVPGTGGRTNDSAQPAVGADPPRPLRRSRSPPSRRSANHPLAAGVNHDASLFCSAPGNGLVARRGGGALSGYCGSAVRRSSASGAAPAGRSLRHNRFGRDRSNYRSRPACGSPRRGTAALTPPRHEMAERLVDLRHHCGDIDPACVPGTVWGTASSLTAKFRSRRRAYPLKRDQFYPPIAAAPACSHAPERCYPARTRHHHSIKSSNPRAPRHFRPSEPLRRIDADSDSHRHPYTCWSGTYRPSPS
jgi:hypothetical protein